MKLAVSQITAFLENPRALSQGALLFGPDEGLVMERQRQLASKVVSDPKDPFCVVEIQPEKLLEDPARLSDELAAISFTGGPRLVLLRGATDRVSPIIEEVLASGSYDTFLIITAGELGPRSSLRALAERHEQLVALACYHDEGRNLEGLIRATLQQAGLTFKREVVDYLSSHLGNDRGVTQHELEKLLLYKHGETQLTLEDVLEAIGANDELKVDNLCAQVGLGDAAGADRSYRRLLHEGEQPIMLARSLMRHFQRLEHLNGKIAEGMDAERAIASLRPPLFYKQIPAFKQQLGKWNASGIVRALNLLLATERRMKSGVYPAEPILGKAILDLSHHLAA